MEDDLKYFGKSKTTTKFPKLCRQTLCLIPLVRHNTVLSKLISNFSLSFLQGENHNILNFTELFLNIVWPHPLNSFNP